MMYTTIKKLLPVAIFALIISAPLSAHATANFSCNSKAVVTNDTAKLVIDQVGTYPIGDIDLNVVPVGASSSTVADTPTNSYAGANAKQEIYVFTFLDTGTTYKVVAVDDNNKVVEEIATCQFTTTGSSTAASTAPITSNPSAQATPVTLPTTASGDLVAPRATTTTSTPTALNVNIGGTTDGSNGMGLIPCDGPDCDLNSVLQLMNNLMTFFFKTLLIPIFVLMIMYLGYSYLTAQGNSAQHAKIKSMAKNMILGLLLILCAWLIVRTVLSLIGYTDDLFFFGK